MGQRFGTVKMKNPCGSVKIRGSIVLEGRQSKAIEALLYCIGRIDGA
jgi:hypothetical protein